VHYERTNLAMENLTPEWNLSDQSTRKLATAEASHAIEPSTRQPPHKLAQRKRNRDAYTSIHGSIDVLEQAWEQAQSAYTEAQEHWLKVEPLVAKIQGHTYLVEEMKAKWYTFRVELREYDRINKRNVLSVINCWK
jgi:hypothetical protein